MNEIIFRHWAIALCLALIVCPPTDAKAQEASDISFSHQRGFYSKAFKLKLKNNQAGTHIRYTLNGAEPTATNSTRYKKPLKISANTSLRAGIFLGDSLQGFTLGQTYLFENNILDQADSIQGWEKKPIRTYFRGEEIKMDYAMDPKITKDPAYREDLISGLKEIPSVAITMTPQQFWDITKGQEKAVVSLELLFPDQADKNVQLNAEIDGTSHNAQKRSYKLEFKKKHGAGKIKTSLLQEYAPVVGKDADDEFDVLVLRGGTQRCWARSWYPDKTTYIRDEWYRSSQIEMSGLGAHGTFVHFYVNGLYMGLYNLTERPDEHFASAYLKGKDEDWTIFKNDEDLKGDPQRLYYLEDTLLSKDLSEKAWYDTFEEYVDVKQYCDYIILSWFCGMSDWPDNNFYTAYNAKAEGPMIFLGWDAEVSWDNEGYGNEGAWVHDEFVADEDGSVLISEIWHAARKNPSFMLTFADRVYKHCFNDGVLTDEASRARWQKIADFIRNPVIAESARWGDALQDGVLRTRDVHWQKEVDRVDQMMIGNVERFLKALRAEGYYPDMDPPVLKEKEGGKQLIPRDGEEVYYTIDGKDPLTKSGKIRKSARGSKEALALPSDGILRARSRSGDQWSAMLKYEL